MRGPPQPLFAGKDSGSRISGVKRRGKIVLLHFVGQMPLAGIAWQAIHHLLALERLGYETWYVEDVGVYPYDPRADSVVESCDYGVAFLRRNLERWGFGERWAYWDVIKDVYHGLPRERVKALFAEADALLNLCGATGLREEHLACPTRVMINTDPGYEQVRYAAGDPTTRSYIDAHTHFFTYGENLGAADCPIPMGGIAWRPTRPPVMLDHWPEPKDVPPCFTTIATWANKGKDVELNGVRYFWSKQANFERFIDLPRQRPEACFRVATRPPNERVRNALDAAGWGVLDPQPISADMDRYRDFIARSRGEFTVAKDIVARTNSGWFSDRSVCYLAAGRPVVTMRTGFSKFYPVGRGLFEFATAEEALAAIDAIARDYEGESRAARAVAHEYFAAERVLGALLAEVGL
jgi:hypothetical protein